MQIFVDRGGQRLGPFSVEEVNRQLAAGSLSPSDNAWYEGAAGWVPLSSVPGVSSAASVAPQPSSAAPAPPQAVAPTPTAAPTASTRKNDPLAIAALVCGIMGFPGSFIVCCGGPMWGIAAVVCGHVALANFAKNPAREGRGLALAGLIMGYVSIALFVLYLLFFGGMAAISALSDHAKNP